MGTFSQVSSLQRIKSSIALRLCDMADHSSAEFEQVQRRSFSLDEAELIKIILDTLQRLLPPGITAYFSKIAIGCAGIVQAKA